MAPKPDPQIREAAKHRVITLKRSRDETHDAADRTKAEADDVMWAAIAKELAAKTLLQRDVAEATGFSRDYVLRRTKRHRNTED